VLPGQGRRQDALTGAIWEWIITIADTCRYEHVDDVADDHVDDIR